VISNNAFARHAFVKPHLALYARDNYVNAYMCAYICATYDVVAFLRDKAVNVISLLSNHLEH